MPAIVMTAAQRKKISELVKLHHQAMLVELLGDHAVPASVLKKLKIRKIYRAPRPEMLRRAFEHGRESLIEPKILSYTRKRFNKYMVKKGMKFTAKEREALSLVFKSVNGYVKSLSEAFENGIAEVITKAEQGLQRRLAAKSRPSVYAEIEQRKAVSEVAKGISTLTKGQLGKANRIIHTETNNAWQEGRAQEILRKAGGGDPTVFKRPRHDACPDCVKAYLEDDGKTPKLFKLSELVENGTNVGKSRGERLPVIDSYHPWCACELGWMPPGFGFDAAGTMAYLGAA